MPKPESHTKSLLAYGDPVVAIDLGSNSFHLLEARLANNEVEPVIALGRKVQLGLDMINNRLSDQAIERGLACLQEFATYTRGRPVERVRVVGTQALRVAENSGDFIERASDLLQHAIEIIPGEEEAELTYLGVEASLLLQRSLLMVDIGGGSTELVAGCGEAVNVVATVPVGCVAYLDHFPNGVLGRRFLAVQDRLPARY
ncbi:MAG: hypothetical protein V3T17_18480 [Pseudomonadales bacterium]